MCTSSVYNLVLSLLYNDFQLSQEWDLEKNDIEPEHVSCNSSDKYWWKCSKGHSLETTATSRNRGNRCPYCSNKKVGYGNDLETLKPDLMSQWDWDKNEFLPSEVISSSSKDAWWLCKSGHSFKKKISGRSNKSKCHLCKNGIEKGTDLASTHPEILEEWDYKRNTVLPTEVRSDSNKKVKWICDKGHSATKPISFKILYPKKCFKCTEETMFKGSLFFIKNKRPNQ